MRTPMRKLLIISLLLLSTSSQAFNSQETSYAAHLGMSYAINTTAYGFFNKVFQFPKEDKWFPMLMAGMLTFSGGLIKEYSDGTIDRRDLEADLIGIGLSAGCIFVFDF